MVRKINIDLTRKEATLGDIYREFEIKPDQEAIVLVLDGGRRIPLPQEYDKNELFSACLKTLAQDMEETYEISINIDSTSRGEFLHHFEVMPRKTADQFESFYSKPRAPIA